MMTRSGEGFAPVYLKINRRSRVARRCMAWWGALCELTGSQLFLVCDWDEADLALLPEVLSHAVVLPTSPAARETVDGKVSPFWRPAGAAQMTVFLDAAERGFDTYWAVDADDTLFVEEPGAIAERLLGVQDWLMTSESACASLDFYQTYGGHWSFGVSCFRGDIDYPAILAGSEVAALAEAYPPVHGQAGSETWGLRDERGGFNPISVAPNVNLDVHFQGLRDSGRLRAESFYLEDTHFMHAGFPLRADYDDSGFTVRGLYHWKDGSLWDDPISPRCLKF